MALYLSTEQVVNALLEGNVLVVVEYPLREHHYRFSCLTTKINKRTLEYGHREQDRSWSAIPFCTNFSKVSRVETLEASNKLFKPEPVPTVEVPVDELSALRARIEELEKRAEQ